MQIHNTVIKYKIAILFILTLLLINCTQNSKKATVKNQQHTLKSEHTLTYGQVDVFDKNTQIPEDVKPFMDVWLRDTYMMLAPDGYYYMTGTTKQKDNHAAWDVNEGIYLWKSKDLKTWEDIGYVWTLDDDATWQKDVVTIKKGTKFDINNKPIGDKRRAVWAPEIHYIKSQNNYYLVGCTPKNPAGKGSYILKSTTGKPEGPYVNIKGNAHGAIFGKIDGSLFEDDDGIVYFIGHSHWIAKMKPDMSGFAEAPKRFIEQPYDKEPYIEGAYIFKYKQHYHLIQAIWSVKQLDGTFSYFGGNPYNTKEEKEENIYSYDVVIASSDNIYGPYSKRYTAVTGGGHNNIFKDKSGNLWGTMFGNPRGTLFPRSFVARPAIVPLEYVNGKFKVKHGIK